MAGEKSCSHFRCTSTSMCGPTKSCVCRWLPLNGSGALRGGSFFMNRDLVACLPCGFYLFMVAPPYRTRGRGLPGSRPLRPCARPERSARTASDRPCACEVFWWLSPSAPVCLACHSIPKRWALAPLVDQAHLGWELLGQRRKTALMAARHCRKITAMCDKFRRVRQPHVDSAVGGVIRYCRNFLRN